MTENYLDSLNEAQREAVLYNDGPALVIAGAGSGKTRVITHKLIHLIHLGYPPDGLYALTFTNKAAREMKERMLESLPHEIVPYIRMGTFHSIFSRILRKHAELMGYSSDFTIYDTSDSKSLTKKIIKDLQLDDQVYSPKRVLHRISACKNNLITPEVYAQNSAQIQQDQVDNFGNFHQIYSIYSARCKRDNAMDFDDILLNFNILLRDFPQAAQACKDSVKYLLIDEYQDTNLSQFIIAKKLVEDHGKIFAVGDDAQSIYAFRGANLDNILSFDKRFPKAKLFRLEQNYRSTQNIVNLANRLIENNRNRIPKELFSEGNVGEKILLQENFWAYDEASKVVRTIQKRHVQDGIPYSEQAILYRTNSQSRILEDALRNFAIPYVVYGGTSFYSRKEIKNVMAYVNLIHNPHNDEALEKTLQYPKKGIGDKSIEAIREFAQTRGVSLFRAIVLIAEGNAKEQGISPALQKKLVLYLNMIRTISQPPQGEGATLAEWMSNIIRLSGISQDLTDSKDPDAEDRLENIKELIHGAGEFESSIAQGLPLENLPSSVDRNMLSLFTQNISLLTDQDTQKEDQDAVPLMTIHASKGLEFDHVYICGVEERILPSSLNDTPEGIEEERRLLYVAITRARKSCQLHYSQLRKRNGRDEEMLPSRFIKELDPAYLQVCAHPPLWGNQEKLYSSRPAELSKNPKEEWHPEPRQTSSIHSSQKLRSIPPEKGISVSQRGNLKVGKKVTHATFGVGVVEELWEEGLNSKAVVLFQDQSKRKLLLRFAKLTPLEE